MGPHPEKVENHLTIGQKTFPEATDMIYILFQPGIIQMSDVQCIPIHSFNFVRSILFVNY